MAPNFGAVKFWRRFGLFGAGFWRHFKKLNEFWRRALGRPSLFWRRFGAKRQLKAVWRRFFNFGAVSFGAVWRQGRTQGRLFASKLTSTPSFLAPVLAPKYFGAVSDVLAP